MKFRNERERRLVLGGGVIAAILLYFGLLIFPVLDAIEADKRALASRQKNLQEARHLAGELIALRAQPTAPTMGTPVQTLDRTLTQLGLQSHVATRRNIGSDNRGFEVRLDDLDGGSLIRLLYTLDQAGIRPSSFELNDFKQQGLWGVTLTVLGPSQ
ncbi:MAG: type II secretion system protein M [Armatimonadetes bacterium]|nr:type II secretion system protein M [Armatimonadota bacterium]